MWCVCVCVESNNEQQNTIVQDFSFDCLPVDDAIAMEIVQPSGNLSGVVTDGSVV